MLSLTPRRRCSVPQPLSNRERSAAKERATNETNVTVELNLDGGKVAV